MANPQQADTHEMGEVIDMIKDLEQAKYYCSIVKAMEEAEEDEEDFETVYQSAVCPKCGHRFYYQPELYEEDEPVQCPKCAETFERKED